MSSQRSQNDHAEQRGVESTLSELLEATQALFDRVAEDAPVSQLDAAYAQRSDAFEALRRLAEGSPLKAPRAVRLIERICELDAELLEGAQQLASDLRADRSTITRARHAITAHTAKERSEPRLLAVRA